MSDIFEVLRSKAEKPLIEFLTACKGERTNVVVKARDKSWHQCQIVFLDPASGNVLLRTNRGGLALVRYDSIEAENG
ncbi:MAG: hypothetical protein KQJ78_03465 [Deltaproteobacteria bacterium]|nr:hypothetical protein [Deltaproteobacteria bacterium]